MARGKVGGTGSRKVGALGRVYTQVKKTANGTYTTYVYEKPVSRLQTNTPAQAKAKLITAVIERPMKSLKNMLRWTMQGATNTTEAVNTFSKINRQLVERDFEENFSGWSRFWYPSKYEPTTCIGPFVIGYGTLHFRLFHETGYKSSWQLQQIGIITGTDICYGAMIRKVRPNNTVGEFLTSHNLYDGSRFYICAFMYDQGTMLCSWALISVVILPYLHKSDILTNDILPSIFKISANCRYYFSLGSDGNLYLGTRFGQQEPNKEYWYFGTAFATRVNGRWLCSNSKMEDTDEHQWEDWHQNNPEDVWPDWIQNLV